MCGDVQKKCVRVSACVCVHVCLYVRETCESACVERARVRVKKSTALWAAFFFFSPFVSRSLSLGGAQQTADTLFLLIISIPPLATSLVFKVGTSRAQFTFVAYASSQSVIFCLFVLGLSLLTTPSVEFYAEYSLLVLNLDLR